MRKRFIAFMIFVCSLSGCSQHYYAVKDDHVHLYLKKSDAHSVYFANSSDGFQLHQAAKIDRTTWEVTVPANREFSYFYVIANTIFLPDCRFKEMDDFGSENCIFMPDM